MTSPTVTPLDPVKAPGNAEEWDAFLTRYSLLGPTAVNFASNNPSAPSSLRSHTPIPRPEPPQNNSASSASADPPSSPSIPPTPVAKLPTTHIPRLDRPDLSRAGSSSPRKADDPLQRTSTAGASNQDPHIPNIPESDLPVKPIGQPLEARLRTEDEPAKGGNPDQTLSLENITRLNVKQTKKKKVSREETSQTSGEERRHRPPIHPELASFEQAESEKSTSGEDTRKVPRPERPPAHRARSRSSSASKRSGDLIKPARRGSIVEAGILESATNTSASVVSGADLEHDVQEDQKRVREFYLSNGYMPAPKQAPDAIRRRLRVIRRLGLDEVDDSHRETLDRFTRLASSIFKTQIAIVTIVTRTKQVFLSPGGTDLTGTEVDSAFCCHTIIGTGQQCMIVPDAVDDWRFRANPLVNNGKGPVRFYAGAPLTVGSGPKAAVIGSLCVLDDKPRHFSEADKSLLQDLAGCVISELELLYTQHATVEGAKLHQISVDFLRRTLRNRPGERPGRGNNSATTSSSSNTGKRLEGADDKFAEANVDIYDEACREIASALDAYAVAIVDLTQFHLFYPAYQTSTVAGSSTRGSSSMQHSMPPGTSRNTGTSSTGSGRVMSHIENVDPSAQDESSEAYSRSVNRKRARATFAVTDVTAPSRTPQVLFIPSKGKGSGSSAIPGQADTADDLGVLGYSCSEDGFAFNFASTPASRKIIADFIANNVKTRRVWYTRDDSEGIAQSINHLMPPGTQTSMAMPVFDFDGQVAFAVVACLTDPLFDYPAGAMQFVETIAGSLLAAVLKEHLQRAQQAQLTFAASASHELRTPLHQINAAASLLRSALDSSLLSPRSSSPLINASTSVPLGSSSMSSHQLISSEDRVEALAQLEIIEANGLSLGHILENIIDTLDFGSVFGKADQALQVVPSNIGKPTAPTEIDPPSGKNKVNFADVLEELIENAITLENKTRKAAGGKGLEEVEVILEVSPRARGGWFMSNDSGPLARSALGKIIHNACKFTNKGYVHITVQDVSRDVILPTGYDNSVRMSTVSIDIKDSGCGMASDFLEKRILKPFAKANQYLPGAGLGLGLAQRMVEILGGKLAIASTLQRGTLIHVELPLHLLNEDNESDHEDLYPDAPGEDQPMYRPPSPKRQDRIYLGGFDSADVGVRRVGKSLLRQLKLHSCRVVHEIHYASLIVVPDDMTMVELAELAQSARTGVQVIILSKDSSERPPMTPDATPSIAQSAAQDILVNIPIVYLNRPLRPSLLSKIMEPAEITLSAPERYVSDVVGGAEATREREVEAGEPVTEAMLKQLTAGGAGSVGTTVRPSRSDPAETTKGSSIENQFKEERDENTDREDILPSPPRSPFKSPRSLGNHPTGAPSDYPFPPKIAEPALNSSGKTTSDESPNRSTKDTHTITPPRPRILELATDPLPAPDLAKEDGGRQTATNGAVGERPKIKEAASAQSVVSERAPDEPYRVLVVEDNAVNRRILTTMLKRTACHYAEAVDGADAVIKFQSFSPNLILLDINMPVKDGFTAAAEIRQLEKSQSRQRCRIIAVTAMSSEQHKRKGLHEIGIDEWLVKPVGIKQLRSDVEKLKAGMSAKAR